MSSIFIHSGNLYHKGELNHALPSYTQGDYITVVLDVDNKTLSFGKNGEEPTLAFQDVEATELFPCVLFYSTNPGEKVKITDYEPKRPLKTLVAGEPHCSPTAVLLSESHISLIRKLHSLDGWTKTVSQFPYLQLSNSLQGNSKFFNSRRLTRSLPSGSITAKRSSTTQAERALQHRRKIVKPWKPAVGQIPSQIFLRKERLSRGIVMILSGFAKRFGQC